VNNSGRRTLLDPATGATLYGISIEPPPKGMIVADIFNGCTVAGLTNWRKHVWAANGDVFMRHANQVAGARRSGGNACDKWVHLTDAYNSDGTNFIDCGDGKPVQMVQFAEADGQFLGLIPATSTHTGGQDLVIFNDRPGNPPSGTLWTFASRIKVVRAGIPADPNSAGALPDPAFQLLYSDGTPLTTAEVPDGIGLYDFFYVPSTDQLLILDFSARKLLVFGNMSTPTGACCALNGSCSTTTEAACLAAGGKYRGNGTSCSTINICPPCVGDMNCDGVVDFKDINPFVAVLSGTASCRSENADVNGDSVIDFKDINPFVGVLSSGAVCP
jgi:hypothetical protein